MFFIFAEFFVPEAPARAEGMNKDYFKRRYIYALFLTS